MNEFRNVSGADRSVKRKSLYCFLFFMAVMTFSLSNQVKAQCVQQVWFDDFNDLSKWDYETGNGCGSAAGCGFGNGELETYTNSASNVSVSGGKLTITALYDAASNSYTSGKLTTKSKLNSSFTYGKIEASMKLSSAGGAWPAFWMLPQNNQWPVTGEIDIMEAKHKAPTVEMGTIHYNYGAHQYTGGQVTTSDLSQAFHTYGVEWQKDKITWFLDGVVFFSVTPDGTVGNSWPFNDTTNPFYLILNLAIGGAGTPFTGNIPPTAADYPTTLQVDWVKVSSGSWNVAVNGSKYVYQNSTANTYSVTAVSGATYSWSVPSGATITSGQGTTSINVNWGTASGDVSVNVTTSCGTTSYKQTVTAEAPFVLDKILEDFETNRNITLKSATGTFVNGTANPGAAAPNTSSTVGKYTRNAAEQYDVLAYKNVDVGDANDFVTRKRRIQMDVYTAAPVGTKITLQLENSASSLSTNFPTGRHSVYEAVVAKQNAWQTLEFKYVSSPDPNVGIFGVDQLVFLYNSNSFTSDTYYFDNLKTGRSGSVPTGTLSGTLLDYDGNNKLTYKSSTGTYAGSVANPSATAPNTSANAGKYTRSSADLYDVLFFTGQVGDAGLYKDETDYFTIDVYTTAPAGTVVSLQLENSTQSLTTNYPTGRNSVYQAKTTKSNAWETIRFYYSSSPDGALSNLKIDQVVILANPNSSTSDLYYFDNLRTYTTDPNRGVAFNTETVLEDYQTNHNITYATSNGTYAPNQASPGGTNATTVGKYTRNATQSYDVLSFSSAAITDAGPFKSRTKKFALDLYTSAPIGTVISLQLETAASVPSNYPTGRNSIYQAVTTKQNTWETLTFSYSSAPDGGASNTAISNIVMLFNPNSSTGDVYYLDNIRTLSQSSSNVAVTGVTVSPTTASIAVGATQQLTATVAPSNATNKTVSWTSSNTAVATVSASGLVTAVAGGTAIITVTTQDGSKTATSTVTVTVPVTGVSMSPTTASVATGSTQQLTATISPSNATNKNVTWTSSNTAVATVNTSGLVSAVAPGTATITVTTQDGAKTATCAVTVANVAVTSVTVSPTTATITTGGTQQLTATVAPSNATNKTVSWSSSNTSVATVNASGLITAVATGPATITVTTQDGAKTATCAVTVTSSNVAVTGVTVSPTSASITSGATQQLTATIAPSNATNKNVTWASSNTGVATVNTSGLVTGVAAGSATITVTTQDGSKTATTAITVTSSGTNLALNKVTTTSSIENASYPGSLAVDGNGTTRWSSAFSDPQWIYVDLGASYSVNRVKITWEAAYASAYTIQTSTDATNWTTIKTVTGNATTTNDWTGLTGTGRYVRMYGTTRATPYGYSIYELEVYGTAVSGTCVHTSQYGDYTVEISSASPNPTLKFIPSRTGVGSPTCILYYGTSATGTYPGYSVTPNTPFQITAAAGTKVYFYYTYSLPTGGEQNTSGSRDSYTVGGSCFGRLAQESEDVSSADYALYPNPVIDILTIRGSKGSRVGIINTQGMEVSAGIMETDSRDVSELASGVYIVKLSKENKMVVRRFIKK